MMKNLIELPNLNRFADEAKKATKLVSDIQNSKLFSDAINKLKLETNGSDSKEKLEEIATTLAKTIKQVDQGCENLVKKLQIADKEIDANHQKIEDLMNELNDKERELNKKIKNADESMALATTVGLASAFDQRAKELKMSMRYWVGLLILALGIGGWLGYEKMQDFLQLIKDSKATSEFIWIYMILALASFGAPLWFAWLASKQIGQRFKLAEDYAFKASVAKAYEGYKTEAARLDKDFEARLFSSALTRLEEAPLRFMNNTEHSSPVHEMIKLCTPAKTQQTESKQPVKTEPE